jgi:hypothetical protein
MAAIVVSVIAACTLISSMFTIITALLDPARFQYPERAIVHLAVCYALLAIGYLVGVSSMNKLYFQRLNFQYLLDNLSLKTILEFVNKGNLGI